MVQVQREELDAVSGRGLLRHRQLVHCELLFESRMRQEIWERSAADIQDPPRPVFGRDQPVGALGTQASQHGLQQSLAPCESTRILGHSVVLAWDGFHDYISRLTLIP